MNMIFCKNLKEARKNSGLTQRKVADMLNVVESCYANWEQGRTEPNTIDLRNICVIFDVSANYLLGLEREDGSKIRVNIGGNNNGNIQIGNNNKNDN